MTYYDDRNNVLGDGIATTEVWLRHSHTGAATWEPEQLLHGPFDPYLRRSRTSRQEILAVSSSATTWDSRPSVAMT